LERKHGSSKAPQDDIRYRLGTAISRCKAEEGSHFADRPPQLNVATWQRNLRSLRSAGAVCLGANRASLHDGVNGRLWFENP
jgi:hypothetical protein